ncbi:pyridoxamine 5'-phosphate oxidase family protein, partial [Thioclava sp. BHET1]
MRDEATREAPVESYPVSPRNRVRRAHERGSYDHAAVHAVLDAGMMAHIAYVIDGQPYCTPTIHWREGSRLYWHGSSACRMLRQQAGGMAVCVTVSHLDGLVLARSGFHHSLNYRSAICFGTARTVEDPVE